MGGRFSKNKREKEAEEALSKVGEATPEANLHSVRALWATLLS